MGNWQLMKLNWPWWEGYFGGRFKKTTMVLRDKGDWSKIKFFVILFCV